MAGAHGNATIFLQIENYLKKQSIKLSNKTHRRKINSHDPSRASQPPRSRMGEDGSWVGPRGPAVALAKDASWLVGERHKGGGPRPPSQPGGRDSPAAGSAGPAGCRGRCRPAGPRAVGTRCPWRPHCQHRAPPRPGPQGRLSGLLAPRWRHPGLGRDTACPEVALTPQVKPLLGDMGQWKWDQSGPPRLWLSWQDPMD